MGRLTTGVIACGVRPSDVPARPAFANSVILGVEPRDSGGSQSDEEQLGDQGGDCVARLPPHRWKRRRGDIGSWYRAWQAPPGQDWGHKPEVSGDRDEIGAKYRNEKAC
jgi:hypothetical protein